MKRDITIRQKYGPAMEIKDQAEADAYFEKCVSHSMVYFGKTRKEAEALERANLGYYAGYYDVETMKRVNRLYRTTHPVFGDTAPSAEDALNAGMELARRQHD